MTVCYSQFLQGIIYFFKYKSWWHYCMAEIKSRCLWSGCFKYSLTSVQLSYIFFVFFPLMRLYWPQSRTVHIYVCPKGPSNMAAKLILLTSLTLEVVLVTFTVVAWQLQWSPKQWIVIALMRSLNRVWNSLGVGYLDITILGLRPGPRFNIDFLSRCDIPIMMIRWSWDHFIFVMGIII